MRRLVYALVFLGICAEIDGDMFAGKWTTWFSPLLQLPNIKLPIKLSLLDLVVLIVLAIARFRAGAQTMRARALDRAMWFSIGSVAVTWIWGILIRGGDAKPTFLQLHSFMMVCPIAFLLMAVLRTPTDYWGLGKTIMFASLWRALMAWSFYIFAVHGKIFPTPPYMTSHCDTVIFVVGIAIAVSHALEFPSLKATLFAVASSLFILVAIQLNNRRLAWVSLVCALIVLYVLFPKGRAKRKFHRGLLMAAPAIALYVIIGSGKTTGIFMPLKALSTTAGGEEDDSTKARNVENIGVILVLQQGPLLSTGWGHQYNPVSRTYSIENLFKETWYIPHNNVLMVAAFNGMLGFMGIWILFPTSVFLAARTNRTTRSPMVRCLSAGSITTTIIYLNQCYGDMGLINASTPYLMASALAVAGRLSAFTGAWPSRRTAADRKLSGQPARAEVIVDGGAQGTGV